MKLEEEEEHERQEQRKEEQQLDLEASVKTLIGFRALCQVKCLQFLNESESMKV